MNVCILKGNLTRDMELTYTASSLSIAKSGVAVNRKWKSKGGEEKEEVAYVDFTLFGGWAENAGDLKKGQAVVIHGRLKTDQWTTDDGQKRSKLCLVANEIYAMRGANKSGDSQTSGARVPRDEYVPF